MPQGLLFVTFVIFGIVATTWIQLAPSVERAVYLLGLTYFVDEPPYKYLLFCRTISPSTLVTVTVRFPTIGLDNGIIKMTSLLEFVIYPAVPKVALIESPVKKYGLQVPKEVDKYILAASNFITSEDMIFVLELSAYIPFPMLSYKPV